MCLNTQWYLSHRSGWILYSGYVAVIAQNSYVFKLIICIFNLKRAGTKCCLSDKTEGLRQEIQSDYAEALNNLPATRASLSESSISTTVVSAIWGENNSQNSNSKNGFKETSRILQRNLLRCHPLIHRPSVHLRSKLMSSNNIIHSSLCSR
jgi:hypothetical protein